MIVETLERGGCKVEIHYDEDGSHADPRDCDNFGLMYCWHPGYKLGDEQFTERDHESLLAAAEYLRHERGAKILIPLFLLDHSGLSIRTGTPITEGLPSREEVASRGRFIGDDAGWDTSMVGFICDTPEGYETTGVDPADAIEALKAEVEEYDLYLRGEVYGYVAYDREGERTGDSCWGFLGDEYVKEEAEATLKWTVEAADREQRERAYWLAREVVTV